jgi:signal transduction histidine kinase
VSATVQGYSQWGSCFDTFPATFAPCLSLTNFQVSLGGVQIFQGTGSLNYGFEQFIEQISSARDTTAGTLGFSVGLINQKWWKSNKVYYADLSRGTRADKEMARNLNISFLNNSNVAIDILVFTIYNEQLVLNVSNGAVQRL